ncbi:ectomycorrhiza-regulated small secreted protein [Laccaria bicolor S238N-H82]|uniref:Ectomycorrhiza-regulated small secreted protein n=1 Tax=Laccaria bicolor (strain S238N-H82 / ATCC MYA-4686) TaxID=486041 RepID=B0DD77_LACBS|nr:ectomycorrhiza-regulated small secreted protein [Laccaria bicolor S238N-H82]EDR07559.1 ectomycorrhiza-regulated small secreted protein [Laccaria bicolor S238N-H82]|eukprot:XP_001881951.1 ectomycorrhiza-regulated small secreted protein [Laccaria bicolor S238N-H82]
MHLKTLCSALLLSFLPTITVAYVRPDLYYIVNRVTPRRGAPLAVTLSGENKQAVISTKTMSPTQQWYITEFDGNGQAIVSASDSSLKAARVGNSLTTIPHSSQVWNIVQTPDGYYRIQNPGGGAKWGVTSADSGSSVVIGTEFGQKGEWIIEAA